MEKWSTVSQLSCGMAKNSQYNMDIHPWNHPGQESHDQESSFSQALPYYENQQGTVMQGQYHNVLHGNRLTIRPQ